MQVHSKTERESGPISVPNLCGLFGMTSLEAFVGSTTVVHLLKPSSGL